MKFLWVNSFIFFLILASLGEAKVSVFSHYFGQPEFIKYQHLFFKKNLLDDYEFVIFEDSKNPAISNEIKNECEKYGITYVRIPDSEYKNPRLPILDSYVGPFSPSHECSIATQYIFDYYVIPSNNICMIMDNDIFLLSPFSVEKYLGNASFSYVEEIRGKAPKIVNYMLPNFVIFNPRLMPEKEKLSFNMGKIYGTPTDSGGCSHFYLLDNSLFGKKINTRYLFSTPSRLKEAFEPDCPLLFNSRSWSSYYFIDTELFLHIRMGSNWSKDPNYPKIKREIETLFDTLLQQP